MLTPDEVRFYHREGYLLVEDVFDAEEVAELNRVTDSYIERSRGVAASDSLFDLAPHHTAKNPVVRRIKNPVAVDEAYARAARKERLLDIVECLVGPGVRFDHSKMNIKTIGGQAAIDWHQDWAFYPHTNDDLLAVGLYLGDCTLENGPLMVIPGSHRGPVLDHHHEGLFVGSCRAGELGALADDAVPLAGRAGSITIHHVRTLHGSLENRLNRDRRLLLMCYMAIDAWPLASEGPFDLAEFDSRILRGEPTLQPRQEALPVRSPVPRIPDSDSIFEDQEMVAGRSFAT